LPPQTDKYLNPTKKLKLLGQDRLTSPSHVQSAAEAATALCLPVLAVAERQVTFCAPLWALSHFHLRSCTSATAGLKKGASGSGGIFYYVNSEALLLSLSK
jgi:hypothetical protein